jgi:hypothetical protein
VNARTIGRLVAALLVSLAAGCSKKAPADRDASRAGAEPAPGAATTQTGDAAAGGEIQVTGTLGCGHCNFHVTPECSASMKTATGALYVLDGVSEGSELWSKRLEPGHEITVVGTVLEAEGIKHVAMTSFEIR